MPLIVLFRVGTKIAKGLAQKKVTSMIKTMTPIEHIRTRLGMYVPTRDNKPMDYAWGVLLYELAADGVRAFARGDASRMEIRYCQETGEIAIGHDGPDGDMCRNIAASFRGEQGRVSNQLEEVYLTRYDWLTYAILSALSQKMTVETYVDGEWRANVCRDGKVGPEEPLLNGLLPADTKRFVWVRFVIDPRYLAEDKGRSPYSADSLQDFGRSLACAHPGLRVIVGKHEYMFPKGIEDMVAEWMAKLDSDVLMKPRMAQSNGMSVACGFVRRRNPHRKISGAAFINGREIKNYDLLAGLIQSTGNCLLDCRCFQSFDYEFFFVASWKVPILSSEASLQYMVDICTRPQSSFFAPQTHSCYVTAFGRCLLKLLGEYMK